VDRDRGSVDEAAPVPKGVTRVASDLWEPGDTTGTTIGLLTCDDVPSSTIHSPYYLYYQL
jgi:hypothetical protein